MINSTFYIFGNLGDGFAQYPIDYTYGILSSFVSRFDVKSEMTVLVVHRENNLMYYGYLRRLVGEQYIGFCVLLNDLMFQNVKELFPVFENAVTFMVTRSGIIGFNTDGDIIAKTPKFLGKEKDVDSAFLYIKSELSKLEDGLKELPPVSYGTSKSETKTFNVTDKDEIIAEASCKYGFTYISKDKGYNSATLSGYKGVITRLNKEKKELEDSYAKLNGDYQKVKKQKKQTDLVIILISVLVILAIVIYAVFDGWNASKQQLSNANDAIVQKDAELDSLQEQKAAVEFNYSQLEKQYNKVQQQCQRKKDSLEYVNGIISVIARCQPFIAVKGSQINFDTGWYKLNYYGLVDGYVNITVRVIFPDNSVSYYTNNVKISRGSGFTHIYLGCSFERYKYYTFELMYGNNVIGGGRYYNYAD